MKAIKGNRVYTITEAEAESFKNEGYDIKDDNGAIVAYGAGKTVSMEKYADLLKRYEALSEENEMLRKAMSEKKEPAKSSKSKSKKKEEETEADKE